jgi:hypothetical protein
MNKLAPTEGIFNLFGSGQTKAADSDPSLGRPMCTELGQ